VRSGGATIFLSRFP
jgi:NAD(P)H-dependent FMN reductase